VYLDQIQRTTEKATSITKQLLAFSRKQVLETRVMDLHLALTASEFMLPRLLGSDIELTFRHEAAHSWILSDPAQIEQVIMNLAVNSRDAMPEAPLDCLHAQCLEAAARRRRCGKPELGRVGSRGYRYGNGRRDSGENFRAVLHDKARR